MCRGANTLLLSLLSLLGSIGISVGCSAPEYDHPLEPTSPQGFFLGADPFNFSGIPSIMPASTGFSVPEGGSVALGVRFSLNAPSALTLNAASSSSLITLGGQQTGSIIFPFGASATEQSITFTGGEDANRTTEPVTITLSSPSVADVALTVQALDTDVSFSDVATLTIAMAADPESTRLADIDGDGKLDLAVGHEASLVHLHRNTSTSGSPSFAGAQVFDVDGGACCARAAPVYFHDLDGDGRKDLIALDDHSFGSSEIRFLRNNSTPGTISLVTPAVVLATVQDPTALAFGDLDGDGLSDMVVADANTGRIMVHRNSSTVGSISFAAGTEFVVGGGAADVVAMADMDGDGKIDIVSGDRTQPASAGLAVYINNSSPGNIALTRFLFDSSPADTTTAGDFRLADIDGDGRTDVLLLRQILYVYRNTSSIGSPSFAAPLQYFETTTESAKDAMEVVDLNGNGLLDIVLLNDFSFANQPIEILRNASSPGAITLRSAYGLTSSAAGFDASLAAGDIDGDGHADFVYTGPFGASRSYIHRSTFGN